VILLDQNLFDSNISKKVIAHGCNAQGVMGSGFALQLKKLYPDAYSDYVLYCSERRHNPEYLLGTNVVTEIGDVTVVSCITQKNYGRHPTQRYVSYDAVDKCLRDLVEVAKYRGKPIHMPFIGGGLANGNRDILLAIFKANLANHNTIVFVPKDLNGG
jgi:O-acetyl-ADP-ribose deacetylase (regulator of RNase III)